ncbi:MAG: cation transporter [Deltaproteobacteria bacterium]|nr:cation transporter [Candidatus Zymogenaceae bacterium]
METHTNPGHDHSDHYRRGVFTERVFEYRSVEKKKLLISLFVTTFFMLVEIVGGILSGSIALISDAGHMFTHCFAIIIGLVAIYIARKPACHHRTFGLYRAEILASFVNGIFLVLVSAVIIYEAVARIISPREVLGLEMFVVAIIGLVANVASIFILKGSHQHDLNVKSVFYHLLADAASSVGVIGAAVVIYYRGWTVVDPIVSIGISIAILYWAWGVLKESGMILMEMAPGGNGFDSDTIATDLMSRFPEISGIFSAHLWAITPDMLVFSAHIGFKDGVKNPISLMPRISEHLFERYRVIESTIQILTDEFGAVCQVPPEIR